MVLSVTGWKQKPGKAAQFFYFFLTENTVLGSNGEECCRLAFSPHKLFFCVSKFFLLSSHQFQRKRKRKKINIQTVLRFLYLHAALQFRLLYLSHMFRMDVLKGVQFSSTVQSQI
jgi:hypothetical protein